MLGLQTLGLVIAAVGVGGFLKVKGWNSPLILIAVGVLLALIPGPAEGAPDPEAVLSLVLAPVIFATALRTSIVDLRETRRSVIALAVVLVIITTLVVGGVVAPMASALTFGGACALGAVLAPTDAVAAAGVAERVGLSRRVRLIIEGESLVNDGTALTALRVAVVAAVSTITVAYAAEIMVFSVVGGLAAGCFFGFTASKVLGRIDLPVVGNAILLVTPFATYECTELLNGSGLLAVVVAGVWIAHTTSTGHAYEIRLQANAIWSLLVFILESCAFVFVGIELYDTASEVKSHDFIGIAALVLLVTILIVITRMVFVFGWYGITRTTKRGRRIAPKEAAKQYAAVSILGARGPISVLAAFSLPLELPGRALILTVTFGVVILSLLASLGYPRLIRLLQIDHSDDRQALDRAALRMAQAALRRLDQLVSEEDTYGNPLPEPLVSRLRMLAVRRIDLLEGSTATIELASTKVAMQRRLQRAMLHAERSELASMRDGEGLPGDVVRRILAELDTREAALGITASHD